MRVQKELPVININVTDCSIAIASDFHYPFQDESAIAAFLTYATVRQPDYIVLNGDLLDFYRLSRFSKGEGRNPKEEIDMVKEFLKTLRDKCPNSNIYYPIGNHETRLEKYVYDKAPEIASIMNNFYELLDCEELGVIGCSKVIFNNSFTCKHGMLLGKKAGMSAMKEIENSYMSGATGHCFSEDVEVLTPTGWRRIIDVNIGETVGTINKETKRFQWNEAKDKFVYDDYKHLYHIKSKVIDLMVTDKHGLVGYNAYNDKFEEFTAAELAVSGKNYKFICAAEKNYKPGVNIDYAMLRLLVNISSDGSIEDNGIRFHLRKERKITHLIALLDLLGMKYSVNKQSCGTTEIRILKESAEPIINAYFPSGKKLPEILRNVSYKQAEIILDEYSITDGNKKAKNSYQISTSKKEEADLLQEIFVKNGFRSSLIKRMYGNYCLTINANPLTSINKNNVSIVPYKGKVSCLTVDNGTLIVRSKGKTVITQNTHRLAKFITRKSENKYIWLETGCLCSLKPEYMLDPDWQQGFCTVEFMDGKLYKATCHEIEDGVIL